MAPIGHATLSFHFYRAHTQLKSSATTTQARTCLHESLMISNKFVTLIAFVWQGALIAFVWQGAPRSGMMMGIWLVPSRN